MLRLQQVIFIDYLKNKKTIIGEYYASLLDNFEKEIKAKMPQLKKISCFIIVMPRLTRWLLRWRNCKNYDTN